MRGPWRTVSIGTLPKLPGQTETGAPLVLMINGATCGSGAMRRDDRTRRQHRKLRRTAARPHDASTRRASPTVASSGARSRAFRRLGIHTGAAAHRTDTPASRAS